MTLSKKYSPLRNKIAAIIFAVLLAFFGLLILSTNWNWGNAVAYTCMFYAIVTSLFFIAQLVGFVISHTMYSEAIEDPKFKLLEIEESEWKH